VLARLAIHSATAYAIDGERIDVGGSVPAIADPMQAPPILAQLQHHLYERCYLAGLARRQPDTVAAHGDDLRTLLSAHHPGRELWDTGWTISQLRSTGEVIVTKQSATRRVWAGEFLNAEPGMPPRVGSLVRVHVPRESPTMQPGFYFAFGETLGDQVEESRYVRFYFNTSADDSPALMRELVALLNRFFVPFRFKCLSMRSTYGRPDAAVLFVAPRFHRITAALVARVHAAHRDRLRPEVPLFTKRLAHGVGFAEDPANGESFGMSRCRVVAEGAWNAFRAGAHGVAATLPIVVEQFRRYGLDAERPWLNPGSTDDGFLLPEAA
jgi:hypothetical protein